MSHGQHHCDYVSRILAKQLVSKQEDSCAARLCTLIEMIEKATAAIGIQAAGNARQ